MTSKLKLSTFLLLVSNLGCLFSQVTNTTLDYSTGGQDSFTRNFYPSTTTNSQNLSTLINGTPSSPNIRRTYIEFDLSSIPKNAIIISGEISLRRYSYSTSPSTVINRISESWDETTLTWNNAPDVHTSDEITTTPTYLNNRHYFDVTDQLQKMVNYQHLNYGWRLRSEDESVSSYSCGKYQTCYTTEGTNYRSFSYSTTSYRPELIVEYVLPIEITLNSITHADTPDSNNGSISVNVSEGDGTYTYQWIDGSTGTDISGETSSSISGLEPGWYGVEVTDGEGNVEYMAFIVGAKCGIVQITFQPDGRFIDDAFIQTGEDGNTSETEDLNFGSSSHLFSERLYSSFMGLTFDYTKEFLFRNLLIIPNNIDLISAEQTFYGYNHLYANGNNSKLLLNTENWQENVVTWYTKPTHNAVVHDLLSTTSSSNENKVLDHKNLYSNYQSGSSTNYGYTVELNYSPIGNTNREMSFYSSDYSTASSRPKLTLEVGKLCFSGYTKLKREKDASYTFTQFGVLKFTFEQPYQMYGNDLDIKLFEEDRTEISLSNLPTINYDDNRVELDLSGLSLTVDNFYYIEVTLPKGGKRYLRFQYKN